MRALPALRVASPPSFSSHVAVGWLLFPTLGPSGTLGMAPEPCGKTGQRRGAEPALLSTSPKAPAVEVPASERSPFPSRDPLLVPAASLNGEMCKSQKRFWMLGTLHSSWKWRLMVASSLTAECLLRGRVCGRRCPCDPCV